MTPGTDGVYRVKAVSVVVLGFRVQGDLPTPSQQLWGVRASAVASCSQWLLERDRLMRKQPL